MEPLARSAALGKMVEPATTPEPDQKNEPTTPPVMSWRPTYPMSTGRGDVIVPAAQAAGDALGHDFAVKQLEMALQVGEISRGEYDLMVEALRRRS